LISSSVGHTVGNESVPIQWALCWFPGLAISDAKILINLSNKIYGNNFSYSTRKLLWFEITRMLIAVIVKNSIVSFSIIFGTLSFPVQLTFVFQFLKDNLSQVLTAR